MWANDVNITTSGKASDGAETDVNCFLWDEDGTTITGLDEEKLSGVTKIKIPSKCKVIRSDYAFNGAEDYRNFVAGIESVEIPSTVTELGYAAFHNFKNLVSIELPDSITKIGENSFRDCEKLENIVLGKNLKEIGNGAFTSCSLSSIAIPVSVTSIGNWVFQCCDNLTNITYNGTKEQWNKINKGESWNYLMPAKTITCTDGVITLQIIMYIKIQRKDGGIYEK